MSTYLIQKKKEELVEIIKELQDKLKEMKTVESQVTAEVSDLTKNAIGLIKDKDGYYSMVKIKFDEEKNAAAIEKLDQIETRDEAIVAYKMNKYVQEEIIRKARGGKYDK